MAAHHDALAVRHDAELLQRTRHLGQGPLEQADGARHVAQAHLALQQRLRGAERDQIRERVRAAPEPATRRRHDAGAIERAQTSRSDLQQTRDLAASEKVGERFPAGVAPSSRARRCSLFRSTRPPPGPNTTWMILSSRRFLRPMAMRSKQHDQFFRARLAVKRAWAGPEAGGDCPRFGDASSRTGTHRIGATRSRARVEKALDAAVRLFLMPLGVARSPWPERVSEECMLHSRCARPLCAAFGLASRPGRVLEDFGLDVDVDADAARHAPHAELGAHAPRWERRSAPAPPRTRSVPPAAARGGRARGARHLIRVCVRDAPAVREEREQHARGPVVGLPVGLGARRAFAP